MSAWPIPDEVVDEIYDVIREWDDHPEVLRDVLAKQFARHRLVQLPEEPDGWLDPVCRNGVPGINTMAYYLTREQATPQDCAAYVLCIPGQPITVDKEESDDNE